MNDDYVKVEGSPNLVKDKITGIVLNNDKSGLAAAKRRKQLAEEQKEENQNQQKVSLLAIGRAHSTRINRLKFSRDGERIVSCGQEGGVFVWRI